MSTDDDLYDMFELFSEDLRPESSRVEDVFQFLALRWGRRPTPREDAEFLAAWHHDRGRLMHRGWTDAATEIFRSEYTHLWGG